MTEYQYLIIGGGMAADAAIRGIRELDAAGTIGLIGAETDPPYDRPPLSKSLWKGKAPDSVFRGTADLGVDLRLGRSIVALDARERRARDDRGDEYVYGKALLATGGTPRTLPFASDRVIHFRTMADYRRLRALADVGKEFLVLGGGFIGSEIAAALAMNGRRVTLAFREETIGARLFPRDLGLFLNAEYRERGVELLPGRSAAGFEKRGDRAAVRLRDAAGAEREVVADAVVAGLGIAPNDALAQEAGIEVNDGIVVDEHLRTGAPEVYAAGDCARFASPALGRRVRVEHEDNANTMGRAAGRNMAGASEPYRHLPFFYSDLFDSGYEAVGEVDTRHQVVADWKEPNREGVVYYLESDRVRGVLLWNVWGQVDAARELIAAPGPVRPEGLPGRLPR